MTPQPLDRAAILRLIPHQGRSCLLDRCLGWTDRTILCATAAHRDPHNPLRRDGLLHAVCGAEVGMQAAALHGALCAGGAPRQGMIVSLRDLRWTSARLDDLASDILRIEATLQASQTTGGAYMFRLLDGPMAVVEGRGVVIYDIRPA